MPRTERLSPIHKSIAVPWNRARAFDRFTRDIASWWPLGTHSLGLERAETVIFEGRVGGEIRESIQGGDQHGAAGRSSLCPRRIRHQGRAHT